MLKLGRSHYESIRQHGEETYPHECCGVLLGQFEGDVRLVTSVARCGNTRTDSPQNRYHIDPKELVRIQREARERGEDIIGFYHSHPDHPSRASQTDTDRAVEIMAWDWSYIIASVQKGKVAGAQSWKLNEAERKFYEEPLVTIEGDSK